MRVFLGADRALIPLSRGLRAYRIWREERVVDTPVTDVAAAALAIVWGCAADEAAAAVDNGVMSAAGSCARSDQDYLLIRSRNPSIGLCY